MQASPCPKEINRELLNDSSCWTIIGTEAVEYSFSLNPTSIQNPVGPVPLITTLEVHRAVFFHALFPCCFVQKIRGQNIGYFILITLSPVVTTKTEDSLSLPFLEMAIKDCAECIKLFFTSTIISTKLFR